MSGNSFFDIHWGAYRMSGETVFQDNFDWNSKAAETQCRADKQISCFFKASAVDILRNADSDISFEVSGNAARSKFTIVRDIIHADRFIQMLTNIFTAKACDGMVLSIPQIFSGFQAEIFQSGVSKRIDRLN